MGEEVVEFDEASPSEGHHDREEDVIGQDFASGEQGGDDDGPKDNRADEAF